MDMYSKFILTVIAVALCAIVAQNSGVVPAVAQSSPPISRVEICGRSFQDTSETICLGMSPVDTFHQLGTLEIMARQR